MSATEEIQAAIDKLTTLKAESTEGPWWAWHSESEHGNSSVDARTDDPDIPTMVAESWVRGDVDLIVTLHATIDAQIKILTGDLELHALNVTAGTEDRWLSAMERAGDLDLVRAINGGA